MRALVIAGDDAPAGFIGERAGQRGVELVTFIRGGAERLPDLDGFDLVIPLGSVWSVCDPAHSWWMDAELALLGEAVRRDVPVLGICFGAQALAAALGADVRRAPRREIGWTTIDTSAPEVIPAGPWFEWHEDTFAMPDGAVPLAHTAVGPQAYRFGPHLGVQFHPEVTGDIVAEWATKGSAVLEAEGIDPAALLAETTGILPAARTAAHRLFDRFLDGS